jgi:hypothetical protein
MLNGLVHSQVLRYLPAKKKVLRYLNEIAEAEIKKKSDVCAIGASGLIRPSKLPTFLAHIRSFVPSKATDRLGF